MLIRYQFHENSQTLYALGTDVGSIFSLCQLHGETFSNAQSLRLDLLQQFCTVFQKPENSNPYALRYNASRSMNAENW